MSRGLALLLATTAVVTALIAVAPVLLGGSADRVCRSPDHPDVSFTRAGPSGGHVVGYTEFTDDAPDLAHIVGAEGLEAVEDPRVQIRGGGTRELPTTDMPGCYVVEGSVPANGSVRVIARAAEEEIRATIDRSRLKGRAGDPIATTRRAIAALSALTERQDVGQRADTPRETVRVSYEGDGYRVQSAAGDFEQQVPGWPMIFYWASLSTFTSIAPVGREVIDDRQLVRLSGFAPVPLWLEILVDPETGNVHRQEMLAAQHFMRSVFSDFRR